jgi:hypothetical protein
MMANSQPSIQLDSDSDGISDAVEGAIVCLDMYDADTDDDGLSDGVEDANRDGVLDTGETDPCKLDTDGDGIQDGTESGLTVADVGPDTDLSVFVPDADPTTTTNPLLSDTDGDGVSDGDEDLDHNGRVDEGEGDPLEDTITNPIIKWNNQYLDGFAARDFAASVVCNNKLYMIGGRDDPPGGGYDATGRIVESYDPQTNTLESLEIYPRTDGRYGAVAACVNNDIYVFGGINANGSYATSTVDAYSITDNTWTLDIASLPRETVHTGAVALNGKIFILGTRSYTRDHNSAVLKFDPSDNSITEVSTMPAARSMFFPQVLGGRIYVIGGVDPGENTLDNVEIFDPASGQWTSGSKLPQPLANLVGGAHRGYIFCGTGQSGTIVPQDKIYAYELVTDTWFELDPIVTSRKWAQGGIIGNQFVIIGGSDEYGRLDGPYLEVGTIASDFKAMPWIPLLLLGE